MQTPMERLQFAVQFAQMDLERLRPGDWLNLRDDLRKFLSYVAESEEELTRVPGRVVAMVSKPPFPKDLPKGDFRGLQQKVQEILRRIVATQEEMDQSGGFSPGGPPGLLLTASYSILPTPPGRQRPPLVWVSGQIESVFFVVLFFLLTHEEANKLRECPECGRIFIKVRKQEYCSRRCVNRVNARDYRQTEKGKERNRTNARKQYERKVKAKLGTKVQVKQRTKTT